MRLCISTRNTSLCRGEFTVGPSTWAGWNQRRRRVLDVATEFQIQQARSRTESNSVQPVPRYPPRITTYSKRAGRIRLKRVINTCRLVVGWFMDRFTTSSCYGDLAIRNSEFGILLVLESRASFPIQWNYYVRRADDPQYRKQKMLRDGCTAHGSQMLD